MKKRILALVLVLTCVFTACNTNNGDISKNEEKATVIATTFAAYDWAKNIIGDAEGIEVKYLVDTKVDLHSYQPSASDIAAYKEADLVVCIGGESEEWIEDIGLDEDKVLSLIDCVSAKEEELVAGMEGEEEVEEGEEEEEGPEYDEHIWLSLKNASVCCNAMKDAFSKIDSSDALIFEKNYESYKNELKDLDEKYQDVVDGGKYDTLIFGDRFPFRYLVDDYDLNYYAAFLGCSAETEASFETIAFLSETASGLDVPAICHIGNEDIAKIVAENMNKKADLVMFYSMQDISNKEAEDTSYMILMKKNLNALSEALGYERGDV